MASDQFERDVPDTSTLGLDIKTEPSNTASDQFERDVPDMSRLRLDIKTELEEVEGLMPIEETERLVEECNREAARLLDNPHHSKYDLRKTCRKAPLEAVDHDDSGTFDPRRERKITPPKRQRRTVLQSDEDVDMETEPQRPHVMPSRPVRQSGENLAADTKHNTDDGKVSLEQGAKATPRQDDALPAALQAMRPMRDARQEIQGFLIARQQMRALHNARPWMQPLRDARQEIQALRAVARGISRSGIGRGMLAASTANLQTNSQHLTQRQLERAVQNARRAILSGCPVPEGVASGPLVEVSQGQSLVPGCNACRTRGRRCSAVHGSYVSPYGPRQARFDQGPERSTFHALSTGEQGPGEAGGDLHLQRSSSYGYFQGLRSVRRPEYGEQRSAPESTDLGRGNRFIPTAERPYLTCTACRGAKKWCSLTNKTNGPPCNRCIDNRLRCTFERVLRTSQEWSDTSVDTSNITERSETSTAIGTTDTTKNKNTSGTTSNTSISTGNQSKTDTATDTPGIMGNKGKTDTAIDKPDLNRNQSKTDTPTDMPDNTEKQNKADVPIGTPGITEEQSNTHAAMDTSSITEDKSKPVTVVDTSGTTENQSNADTAMDTCSIAEDTSRADTAMDTSSIIEDKSKPDTAANTFGTAKDQSNTDTATGTSGNTETERRYAALADRIEKAAEKAGLLHASGATEAESSHAAFFSIVKKIGAEESSMPHTSGRAEEEREEAKQSAASVPSIEIWTRFAHPIELGSENVDGSNDCSWCKDKNFGIIGHGRELKVRVIPGEKGEGYTEVSGGYVERGVPPDKMCTTCTMSRYLIAFCEHEFRMLSGMDPETDALKEALPGALQHLRMNDGGGAKDTNDSNMFWCSMCPSPAGWVCAAEKPLGVEGIWTEEDGTNIGCGLLLCHICLLILCEKCDEDLSTLVKFMSSSSGFEYYPCGARADAEFCLITGDVVTRIEAADMGEDTDVGDEIDMGHEMGDEIDKGDDMGDDMGDEIDMTDETNTKKKTDIGDEIDTENETDKGE